MRYILAAVIVTCCLCQTLFGQGSGIVWTLTPDSTLPTSVRFYSGLRADPLVRAWYLDVDLNDTSVAIRPYLSTAPGGKEGIVPFVQRFSAYAGINGGYFDIAGSASYSAVVYPDQVLAQNVASVTRSGLVYTLTRSLFSVTRQRQMRVDWIFHFGGGASDIFTYPQPTPNVPGLPAPPPDTLSGSRYTQLLVGLGGGPTLVKNGQVNITYDPEVFFGSGVGYSNTDPRTAVGFTANRHAILLVVDGRNLLWSYGVSLPELAQVMIELNCIEAMNLDGGGSTQMAIGGTLINRPEGGTYQRPIPTILALVRSDSLRLPPRVLFEKIHDTGDTSVSLIGSGWFASANPGYWGTTPAMLNPRGAGEAYALFRPGLARRAVYEIQGWWVSSSNRCTDTPFIVEHANGTDTVRVNQTTNGSRWVTIGTYTFRGNSLDRVIISNAATSGSYIVADAIRIISYDSAAVTSVRGSELAGVPSDLFLEQSFPNPFNPLAEIRFSVPVTDRAVLSLYDVLGKEVARLFDDVAAAGTTYTTVVDGTSLSTGVYFYRLEQGAMSAVRKLTLLR